MYTLWVEHHAAPGKLAELRTAVEERARASSAGGRPQAIMEQVMPSSPADPSIIAAIRFDSITGLDNDISSRSNDADYQAQVQRIGAALGRDRQVTLMENLVTAQPTGQVGNVLTVRFFSAPGKSGELGRLLQDTAEQQAPRGTLGVGLLTEVVPEEGPNFSLNLLFADLAGFEEWRATSRSDGSLAAFAEKLDGLVSRAASQKLFKAVIPF